jgi:hypothetical protein
MIGLAAMAWVCLASCTPSAGGADHLSPSGSALGPDSSSQFGSVPLVVGVSNATAGTSPSTQAPSSPSSMPSSRARSVPDRRASQLSVSVEGRQTGPTNGTENVVLQFLNVSRAACWLGGLPRLSATTLAGESHALKFEASRSSAYASQYPADGPGPVRPGLYGALHLTVGYDPSSCPSSPPRYRTLIVELETRQVLSMSFPAALERSGCLGGEGEIGPVTHP